MLGSGTALPASSGTAFPDAREPGADYCGGDGIGASGTRTRTPPAISPQETKKSKRSTGIQQEDVIMKKKRRIKPQKPQL
jgi:hypothetical protein